MASLEVRKAAILLMSLPTDQAAQLLSKLDPKQVELVSIEIAKLEFESGKIPIDVKRPAKVAKKGEKN